MSANRNVASDQRAWPVSGSRSVRRRTVSDPSSLTAMTRITSPLASVRPVSPASKLVVVAAGDDDVPGAGAGAVAQLGGPGVVDQAEVDEVVADPAGQFPAGLVRAGDHAARPGLQVGAQVRGTGLVQGQVGLVAGDPAVLVVVLERAGIAAAQAERGVPFPSLRETDSSASWT